MAKKDKTKKRKKQSGIKKGIRTVLTIITVLAALFGGSVVYDLDLFTDGPKATSGVGKPSTQLAGKVIRVSDGDTVVLLDSLNTKYKIRLDGIDCPETGQDFGTKATNFTKELCLDKHIVVDVIGVDQYQRTLGIVWSGSVNVNEKLLENGLAWRYKYNKSKRYLQLEEDARARKINIWSMRNPVAPWDFRKNK